jgi:hypothetical protein
VGEARPGAEITRLKDGRTALAYKSEQAVDMESGAIVAVTAHGGSAADTDTVEATVIQAGVAVARVAGERDAKGQYPVHPGGIQEVSPIRDITATECSAACMNCR